MTHDLEDDLHIALANSSAERSKKKRMTEKDEEAKRKFAVHKY